MTAKGGDLEVGWVILQSRGTYVSKDKWWNCNAQGVEVVVVVLQAIDVECVVTKPIKERIVDGLSA